MNQPGSFSFGRRNVVFLSLCLGGLTILVLMSLLPLRSQHQAIDQEIITLESEQESQQKNQISIAMVEGILAKLDQQPGPQVIAISPLAQDKTDTIIEDMKSITEQSSLHLQEIAPQLDNQNTWQTLTVNAKIQGQFQDLQPFLLKLLSLPYVKQIERLEIHPGGTTLNFSLTYTISLG